jgi:hypothetical protein
MTEELRLLSGEDRGDEGLTVSAELGLMRNSLASGLDIIKI